MDKVVFSLLPPIVGATLGGPMWIIMALLLLRGDSGSLKAAAFAAGGIDLCRELIEGIAPRSSGKSRSLRGKEEVQVALHGLEFDAGEEEELRDLIWMLVEKRIEGAGVRP